MKTIGTNIRAGCVAKYYSHEVIRRVFTEDLSKDEGDRRIGKRLTRRRAVPATWPRDPIANSFSRRIRPCELAGKSGHLTFNRRRNILGVYVCTRELSPCILE